LLLLLQPLLLLLIWSVGKQVAMATTLAQEESTATELIGSLIELDSTDAEFELISVESAEDLEHAYGIGPSGPQANSCCCCSSPCCCCWPIGLNGDGNGPSPFRPARRESIDDRVGASPQLWFRHGLAAPTERVKKGDTEFGLITADPA
jgi:hypothetical protein